jgi:hypothetical protein
LAGLRVSTTARRQKTVNRLRTAIESLKSKKQAITAQTIYAECGLHYSSYVRNEEAITLFRASSTHLTEKRRRTKLKQKTGDDPTPEPSSRDPLLNYKKPQLVMRLRDAQQQILDLERERAILAEACLLRDTRVAELEAKLKELEPYWGFVQQIRQCTQREKYDNSTLS